MRVLVIGSCGKKKRFVPPETLDCESIRSRDDLAKYRKMFSDTVCSARYMYTGNQSRELGIGVDLLRSIQNVEVDYYIISAGFGLLEENEEIPPYECSFSNMKVSQIRERSVQLAIPEQFREVTSKRYDLIYLALGSKYLAALPSKWYEELSGLIVMFHKPRASERMLILHSGANIVKRYSSVGHKIHGVAGFKGDLLRVFASHACTQPDPYSEVMNWTDAFYFSELFHNLGKVW